MAYNRSLDADSIYNKYVEYCQEIDQEINKINQLPPDKRNQPNVQQDLARLNQLKQQLGPIYQKDYASDTATLASFIQDCSTVLADVAAAFTDAMGGNASISTKIANDYQEGQQIVNGLVSGISKDQSSLQSLAALQALLASLKTAIDQMADGPQKQKAQKDYQAALDACAALQTAIANAQPQLALLQALVASITGKGGLLDQLKDLANKSNPTEQDLKTAEAILASIQKAMSQFNTFENGAMAAVNTALQTATRAVAAVKADVQPGPTPGKVEHSCWYIDWTSWDTPIPEGVDTVNIFVGKLNYVDGKPTVDGFGSFSMDKLDAFIKACHEKGIKVKVSIGGGGGSYDNCWDLLTKDNVQAFAQGLADFCAAHGVDGIDFDYEEYKSPEQEALVGTLIREFKAINPNLQTSLCTNAGFGTNFPWQQVVKNILDAAMDPQTGKCMVDKLYIMSYYQPMDQEEGWILGWANWLKENYGFDPSRIGVGLDDFDAHAYDIGAFAKWAASQGFSTGYWAWNPAFADKSNVSSTEILNAYNGS